MDLRVIIIDENGDTLESVNIYQDGSDSGGAARIIDWIEANFNVEEYE